MPRVITIETIIQIEHGEKPCILCIHRLHEHPACTHKGADLETCHCVCQVCGLEDCRCCSKCDRPDCICQEEEI